MRRRGFTVLAGAIIVALLTIGLMTAPVPYVVLDAGPTVDTLGDNDEGAEVIDVVGTETSEPVGELRLTTVLVHPELNLVGAVRAWLDDEQAVVPRELVYPPGQTEREIQEENAQQFASSQTTAELAALRQLGYPVQVTVVTVVEGSGAAGVLRVGDVITAVNGEPVDDVTGLREAVTAHPAGTTLAVDYRRDGEPGTAEVTTAGDADGTPRLGVQVTATADIPFELEIDLEHIGGPSAGLMFALGIVDKLEPADLTGGRIIAGTGTIDRHGNVGPIGGIPQKLIGATDAGATVFLSPAANCAEALANLPPGLTLVRVESLAGALDELAALRAGGAPTPCG